MNIILLWIIKNMRYINLNLFQSLAIIILLYFTVYTSCYADKLTTSAKCDMVIGYQAYTVCYSYKYKTPLFSNYVVTSTMINAKNLKYLSWFHQDRNIPKEYRSTVLDYYSGSGYVKGHLAPNSALNYTMAAQYQLFSLANIAPQNGNLNNSLWKKIENHVRKLAKDNIISVTTGVCYTDGSNKTIGKNLIYIPDAFFKVVQNGVESEIYYAKNTKHSNTNISDYIVNKTAFNKLCNTVTIR